MDKELSIFEDYYHKFDSNNESIYRKYTHTFRVMKYSEEIAKSIDLDDKEITRAKVCALFHDIGRFPQFSQYNTFIDSKSFDHGDKSEEILREFNYDDDIVLKAVKYHNKFSVPKFDELTNIHCKIVRDADKLDIMDMQHNKLESNDYPYTDKLLNCFKEHILLDNDFDDVEVIYVLRMLAFIFDINYKKTIEIILEKNIIDRKINILRNENNKKELDFIENEIRNYIKERFDVIC